jgi:hypothetical protein
MRPPPPGAGIYLIKWRRAALLKGDPTAMFYFYPPIRGGRVEARGAQASPPINRRLSESNTVIDGPFAFLR